MSGAVTIDGRPPTVYTARWSIERQTAARGPSALADLGLLACQPVTPQILFERIIYFAFPLGVILSFVTMLQKVGTQKFESLGVQKWGGLSLAAQYKFVSKPMLSLRRDVR